MQHLDIVIAKSFEGLSVLLKAKGLQAGRNSLRLWGWYVRPKRLPPRARTRRPRGRPTGESCVEPAFKSPEKV